MRLVFAGTPAVALPALEAVLASRHEVVAVLTRPDAPAGRGRRTAASPVAERATSAGIEVLTPGRPGDPAFVQRLTELAPDCCPVVAYGALVPRRVLDLPVHGWVNLHFSLLPAWRGAAPVQHAVMAGDEVTGATTFRLEAGLDTGPVYGLLTETVRPTDTSGELLSRLSDAGAGLLVATLDAIADGSITPRPQSADGVSLAPKVDVADAGRREVEVGTATVPVVLTTVQPQGRRAMPAADWARGSRLLPDERLGDERLGDDRASDVAGATS